MLFALQIVGAIGLRDDVRVGILIRFIVVGREVLRPGEPCREMRAGVANGIESDVLERIRSVERLLVVLQLTEDSLRWRGLRSLVDVLGLETGDVILQPGDRCGVIETVFSLPDVREQHRLELVEHEEGTESAIIEMIGDCFLHVCDARHWRTLAGAHAWHIFGQAVVVDQRRDPAAFVSPSRFRKSRLI